MISTIKKGKVCRICWRKQVLTIYTRAYMPRLNCWNLYLGFPFTVCRNNNENSLCIITQQEDYRESEKARLREKVDAFLQKKFLSHRWGQCFYYVLLFIQNIFWFLIPWLILHNQPSAFTKFGGLFVKMTPVVQNIVQKGRLWGRGWGQLPNWDEDSGGNFHTFFEDAMAELLLKYNSMYIAKDPTQWIPIALWRISVHICICQERGKKWTRIRLLYIDLGKHVLKSKIFLRNIIK